MINFGPSSQLKAWFDHVTWPGVTFSYGDTAPTGQLTGKKVYLALFRATGPTGRHINGRLRTLSVDERHRSTCSERGSLARLQFDQAD
jgi:hypothetical protein